ncbi:hypothetical protein Aab01nite_36280 [Paractinoplanes abujensis]|uniref:Uncharacterized protein n=1 Tax=Paractinoplanes abujensis TaxID=882441 RepID=A0A7W7G3Z4_9ACTN|nr:hypothetical protein [Actinoplanes abujensis]MBB4694750.1 hypothetical protein [Actinoplanes abujensis]GID20038.1 hypothetical protein Aab01nite_36280 [Actinoplanes abujensis]
MGRYARARLASQVMRCLRRAGFTEVRYDAPAFQVRFTTNVRSEPAILDLAPLLTPRKGRKKRIQAYVSGLSPDPIPPDWQTARPLLRPVLRGGTPGNPIKRPAFPYLSEYVVIDHPEAMTYVTDQQLQTWHVRPDEVFKSARANLEAATLQGAPTELVRFVDDGDAYWTSHLLLEHWLQRLEPQVGGPPVAFAPERGTLLITSAESPHLRAVFAQAEELYARSPRPITPMAYVSDAQGCTVPFSVPEDHPLHHTVRRAERILAVQEYARQAAHLTEPAAELVLVGDDETGWRTRAAWDGEALLPTADEVQLGDRTVPWPELDVEPVPGLEPIRWTTAGAPQSPPPRAPRARRRPRRSR